MADEKPLSGESASNAAAQPGGSNGIQGGAGSSEDIMESLHNVLKTAGEQSNEDVKSTMEHMKGEGGGGLDELPAVQDSMQHQSQSLQTISNILKKMSDTAASIITKGGGLPTGAGKKKTALGILAGLLLLGTAAFVGSRLIPTPGPPDKPAEGLGDTTLPEPGPPDPPAEIGQPVYWPPNPCALTFQSPASAESIPLSGPLELRWSEVAEAASYKLHVIPPAGGGSPWVMPVEGTSRKIYMENFPAAGQHKFAVSALDLNGAELCSTEMIFDKPALDSGQQSRESDGGACNSMFACP